MKGVVGQLTKINQMNEPLHYDQIHYNEVIYHLEQEWKRNLTPHEISVLVYGYRLGRYVEMENNFIHEQLRGNKEVENDSLF